MSSESIVVRGARVHNLKNIDFEIAHGTMTVVTGVSGSGKSSLAFDTIYAEGQRRYVESLSAYARQFLERIEKPDVDVIDGIAPAIAIRQKNTTRNPRSTVATATEIYDYMRLLFARVGRTYCYNCGAEVKRDTVDEIAAVVLELEEGTRLNVLFPLHVHTHKPAAVPKRKGAHKAAKGEVRPDADLLRDRLFDLRKRGFNRLFQNGQVVEFSTPESLLDLDFKQPVFVLVDRIVVTQEIRARMVDAVELAYRESGEVVFEGAMQEGTQPLRLRFAQRFECKKCHIRYEEPEPRLFSFNNPYGACPKCQGFGNTIDFDLDLVIPDKTKTLAEGAVEPWTKPKYRPLFQELRKFARSKNIPMDVPWEELERDQQRLIVEGDRTFDGVTGFFAYLERKKYKLHVRVFLSRYRGHATCSTCGGSRLRLEARQVKVNCKNICEVCSLTVESAAKFFQSLTLSKLEEGIAGKILEEIQERLKFLLDVGLEYLTLDRLSSTLSGGEAQRIQLATSLGSRLVGALYVLDEPSIGLHSRDTSRLVKILHNLRDLGNTILVVEHDPEIMRASDRILDLGPGAGETGGKVIASGTFNEIKKMPQSLTGRYLSGELRIQTGQTRRKPSSRELKLFGARAHNLKALNLTIPLGMIVAVTGVSGSGKSTLVHDVLYNALAAATSQIAPGSAAGRYERLEGAQYVSEVILVDQSPIGRTPRSNPVTYIKAFDCIREVFSTLPEAQKRGYAAGHFSFNIPGGRCDACEGDGTVTVEMQFLADVELICEECKGTRYKPGVLEIRYHGKNIHEVLNLTVREALQFYSGVAKITDKLRVLEEVGLGYLRLGQSATTLSGGEAQRMKLAAHLQPRSNREPSSPEQPGKKHPIVKGPLYIFDEPTTGLHFDDVSKLLAAFRRLIEAGGSILVIEHNLDVIKVADWVIDLGPEGGERGGEVVVVGPPEAIVKSAKSHTGKWLGRILSSNGNSRSNGRK
ncbi:MAG: excinuclease ABC subunit UvrA [Candidatus Koribacter versatilis]|uniref:UvrABC system protein A n=1 Tax=Candidatus Korobacter versatilis TaxID=658062 RepID=A0A932A7D2_9BACT|nr:excinuclease ABC subunit UvrA [Candidatus Koribacter versatilis]